MQEINDLKNIVIQSLESNGVLSQLRAQIRSSVFKIIEDQESRDGKSPAFFWENPLCQKIHKTNEGPVALELMHEFMEFYRMDYTCNVFVHESNYKATTERQALVSKLNLGTDDPSKPLLALIIDRLSSGSAPRAATTGIEGTSVTSNPKLVKDKESIEAAISDLRKPDDRSKDLIQQAKEAPTFSQASSGQQAAGRDFLPMTKDIPKASLIESDKQIKADPKKAVSNMMGAKKETDLPVSAPTTEKQKKETSEDSLPGKKFQNLPDDAMKKNKGGAFLEKEDEVDDPDLDYPHGVGGEEQGEGMEEEGNEINHLVTSDEMYMSESYGYNFSVTSEAMDQFDYVEDIEPVDE